VSNPQPGGPGPCIYVPQWQGGQLYPQAPGSLSVTFYNSQGYGGGILTCLHMGDFLFNQQKFQRKFTILMKLLKNKCAVHICSPVMWYFFQLPQAALLSSLK
jgi:hypothetical protein